MIKTKEEYIKALDRMDMIFSVTEDDPEWEEHLQLTQDILDYENFQKKALDFSHGSMSGKENFKYRRWN